MNLLTIISGSRRRIGLDPDASDYFARIVTAGSSISSANQTAVNAFIVGCKTDGIWSSIKASCLLCAVDSLAGALVPLVGTAPTNSGFVPADYSRTTGLLGNGSTKYITSNRLGNADPQNSFHLATWVSQIGSSGSIRGFIGHGQTSIGSSNLNTDASNNTNGRCRSSSAFTGSSLSTGFFGLSRNSSVGYEYRNGGISTPVTQASQTTNTGSIIVFSRGATNSNLSNSRQAFYSIGESINLSLLDARLTTLMSSLT